MSILLGENDGLFQTRALEIHLTHTCNLHCDGCRHYSNYNHAGMLSVAEFRDWLGQWSKRIRPNKLRLLGGEPTLNPGLVEMVHIAHEIWPETVRQITTNGYFLDRHPDLLDAVIATGTRIGMTIHSSDPAYLKKVAPIRDGLEAFRKRTGAKLFIEEVDEIWTRSYLGTGDTMRPFTDDDPRRSWENCVSARYCMQLHENRLWKCAPIAYLRMQLEKFGLTDQADWSGYLAYGSLGLEADDDEMRDFLGREDEFICAMCPVQPPHLHDKSIDWRAEFRPSA